MTLLLLEKARRKAGPSPGQLGMNFDEESHPRAGAGTHGGRYKGGEFVPKAKQPHEMTREEYRRQIISDEEIAYRPEAERRAKEEEADLPNRQGFEYSSGEKRQILGGPNMGLARLESIDSRVRIAEKRHRRLVEQAFAEGKEIPPEVLAEYPDLGKETGPGKGDYVAYRTQESPHGWLRGRVERRNGDVVYLENEWRPVHTTSILAHSPDWERVSKWEPEPGTDLHRKWTTAMEEEDREAQRAEGAQQERARQEARGLGYKLTREEGIEQAKRFAGENPGREFITDTYGASGLYQVFEEDERENLGTGIDPHSFLVPEKPGPELLMEPEKPAKELQLPVGDGEQRVGGRPIEVGGAEGLRQQFGLRGVTGGASVKGKTADFHIRGAAGAFMDLADVLGLEDRDVGFQQTLGFTVGVKSKRNAYATYMPGARIINMGIKEGAGSLAHEWWHAFDNIIARRVLNYAGPSSFASAGVSATSQTAAGKAIHKLVETIRGSDYQQQAKKIGVKTRFPAGWVGAVELTARAFSAYVQDKLEEQGRKNTYLVDHTRHTDFFDQHELHPYPRGEERKKFNEAFDAVFEAVRNSTQILKALRRAWSGGQPMLLVKARRKVAPSRGQLALFVEADHPRAEAGTHEGGQFVKREEPAPEKPAPEPSKAVVATFENPEEGVRVHVAQVPGGYSVALQDAESQEYLPVVMIYPTRERAEAEAKKAAGLAEEPAPEQPLAPPAKPESTDPHLVKLDRKIEQHRARLESLNGAQDRSRELSAQTGWDIGGIRTRAGRRSAGRRLDATIDRATEIVRLTRELDQMQGERAAYAAGKITAQGRRKKPSGEQLQQLIRGGEEILARGTRKNGEPYSAEDLANLKDVLKEYRALARKEEREAAKVSQPPKIQASAEDGFGKWLEPKEKPAEEPKPEQGHGKPGVPATASGGAQERRIDYATIGFGMEFRAPAYMEDAQGYKHLEDADLNNVRAKLWFSDDAPGEQKVRVYVSAIAKAPGYRPQKAQLGMFEIGHRSGQLEAYGPKNSPEFMRGSMSDDDMHRLQQSVIKLLAEAGKQIGESAHDRGKRLAAERGAENQQRVVDAGSATELPEIRGREQDVRMAQDFRERVLGAVQQYLTHYEQNAATIDNYSTPKQIANTMERRRKALAYMRTEAEANFWIGRQGWQSATTTMGTKLDDLYRSAGLGKRVKKSLALLVTIGDPDAR